MKAVVFGGKGGPEVIALRELPDPSPARGEVLVRVRAAALNRADLLQRRGLYPPPPGYREDVPGLELAGEVAAVGAGVTAWKPGDRVMAIAAGEAQAELCLVHERMLVRIPDRLSFEEAGAIPEAGMTSHDALFTLGGLRPGWPVLIHAVGSGVSTAAVQIAKAAGATVIGTSRTAEKLERARALGLDHGILVGKDEPRFADEVKKVAGRCPLVLDFVGGPYTAENLAVLATGGRIVVIGTMGGGKPTVDLGALMRARGSIVGTVLRPRPLEEKIAATQAFAKDVLPLVAAGKVKPVVDAVIPAAQVREAHERMERNESFGKLVLAF
ncbi:NAD(P)H-quinone oxidoreductase [Anaeromyxobacter dehalogenans]|uniref:Zinc-binding alcohol dehydrogenase n=1 Tax=Anaeromyxobacter dehalogenans (strain 2CP-C) TaxID=290397 RepID=Q2IGY8_ANADE|nr:NAD(P)H-quinone oxidoreductase [Anaeromyxobacter dehalogenans]ABC83848.1 zinc-binding alcohol dehydrogenase [Anaeromyxobacter dehalogenans 2CP-C]